MAQLIVEIQHGKRKEKKDDSFGSNFTIFLPSDREIFPKLTSAYKIFELLKLDHIVTLYRQIIQQKRRKMM